MNGVNVKPLAAKEVNKAIKDVRAQLAKVRVAVDAGMRPETLRETEHLYSLVFDMRALVQSGGAWEPDEL